MKSAGDGREPHFLAPSLNRVHTALRIARNDESLTQLGLSIPHGQQSHLLTIRVGRPVNIKVPSQIRVGFFDRFVQATRHIDMKLAEDFGLGKIMPGSSKRVAVGSNKSWQ